ncbi:hypothetical protein GDO81_023815 [Engystomops pustulosus]|uniref:Uncharacterized protein n=1 Tax=Engystomops pustulosus TaxID=76066 RepID=A0AAV6YUX8_ENGPU|nr:hypothetical protein GDO81_023815 [Engystomops pustulosus]
MMPRHMPVGHAGAASGSVPPFNFPVNYLQRAGVLVQKVVTTTDIVIPGMTTSTDVQARISAGESIHVIRGTKGTYIRTSDGRIFAIRSSSKQKSSEPRRPAQLGAQGHGPASGPSGPYMSNGRHPATPPSHDSEEPSRPLSPDSPEILSELQQYTDAAGSRSAHGNASLPNIHPQGLMQAPKPQSRKRKEPPDPSGQWSSSKRHLYSQLPFPGLPGFGVNPSSLNHSLSRAANSVYMGAGGGASHFQLPSLLSDPQLGLPMVPDSLLTPTSGTSSAPSSVPPYLLPPSFPMPFSQPLPAQTRMFAPFPSSMLNRGLPTNSAASTFPGYLSSQPGYQPPAAGNAGRPLPAGERESSEEDGKDDDVVEVTGK